MDLNLSNVSYSVGTYPSSVWAVVVPFIIEKGDVVIASCAVPKHIKEVGGGLHVDEREGNGRVICYVEIKPDEIRNEEKIRKAIEALPAYLVNVIVDVSAPKVEMSLFMQTLLKEMFMVNVSNWKIGKTIKADKLRNITVVGGTTFEYESTLKVAQALAEAQVWVKKVVSMPSNHLTPEKFKNEMIALFDRLPKDVREKVSIEAYDEVWAKDMGMGSFLSVTQGSENPALFVEIKYSGDVDSNAPFVAVGKGVTFDTGGISLKPSKGMGEMKGDMAGAANACALAYFAARAGLKQNVVSLTPLCENMPSGSAIKPGDVVEAMNGKTIEITNTDAEGRLILADALVYSQKFNGWVTVDIATLTGACITALGYEYTGVFTDEEGIAQKLEEIGRSLSDYAWHMPMDSRLHKSMLKSAVADMANSSEGTGGAGATNGAIFLKEFAPEKNWVHLDIAGVSEVRGSAAPTGRPLPLLANFLLSSK